MLLIRGRGNELHFGVFDMMNKRDNSTIRETFLAPTSRTRSFPFWAWNNRLEEGEIRNQIREMKRQGMGGFFMHSREGLETEYMGEDWDACIRAAVEEAKENKLYAWLYDEDRWPSGTAGGKVCAGGDAYRCKGLTLEVCTKFETKWLEEETIIALYAVIVEKDRIRHCRRLHKADDSLKEKEIGLIARVEVSAGSDWFNGETPPDNLNPDTVKRFIALTHEHYYALVGKDFGTVIPGIFTDEPSLADNHAAFPPNRGWIPWTYGFEAYFQSLRGYDILSLLPWIYFNGEYSRKIRHDYWWMIALRFSEAYSKTLGEWCANHDLALTGHFLQEDKLGLGTRVNGAIMPHYEYQQIPGIDMLREETEEFMTVKQCTSVANQLDKPIVLSETYGCTGWEFGFDGQKRVGDWQYALGVNRRCQHLALYSIAGCRKRDYPPSFNYNNTWWEKCHVVEDYFARLGAVLENGHAVRSILLMHPISTAWSRLGVNPYGNPVRRFERDVPAINEYGFGFNRLIKLLSLNHYDVDLGDEIIMGKYAKVEGSCFCVGRAKYDVIIIPSIDTMLKSSFQYLKDYVANGGRFYAIKPCATMLEGEESEALIQFFKEQEQHCVNSNEELLNRLNSEEARIVRVKNEFGLEDNHTLALLKENGDDYYLFVSNYEANQARDVTISCAINGEVEEWDALTGEIKPILQPIDVHLEPSESKLYCIHTKDREKGEIKPKKWFRIGEDFPMETRITVEMENTLPIDRCKYKIKDDNWSEELDIWKAQCLIRKALQMPLIHKNGMVQRYQWINDKHGNNGIEVGLKMRVKVREIPKECFFVIENSENFTIYLNGIEVKKQKVGYLLDKSFHKIPLPTLKEGDNRLEVYCAYTNATELENCYLCGPFGINTRREVVSLPTQLSVGDWTLQGLYHYSGSVTYHYTYHLSKKGETEFKLELEKYAATCATICVNGNVIEIPWKSVASPNITSYLVEGTNRIDISIMGSPRNLLGPFHMAARKRDITNDASFTTEGVEYTSNYNVVPYGLFAPPRIWIAQ